MSNFIFFESHAIKIIMPNNCVKVQHLLLAYGKNVQTVIEQPLESEPLHAGKNTVTYEARLLKSLLLRVA